MILQQGDILTSPGAAFSYEVVGPVCQLYDREQLPYPCCRLQWQSKEPYWNRVGKRFVLDGATKHHASYAVRMINSRKIFILTVYWQKLTPELQGWWHTTDKQKVVYLQLHQAA
jgi:hypothetical protein